GSGGIGSAQRVRSTREHWTGPQDRWRRGGDGCGRPASAGGIVARRYDGSGSDFLSGTISEGDSSSRLASINARRIFSITVISVFIAIRLSRVPAHCSSLLESQFERTARCRAVFRMASEASFRWTASSVNVSRSMIMSNPLARPGSETGAMIREGPGPGRPPAACPGVAQAGASERRDVPFTSRELGALAARGRGAAGAGRGGRGHAVRPVPGGGGERRGARVGAQVPQAEELARRPPLRLLVGDEVDGLVVERIADGDHVRRAVGSRGGEVAHPVRLKELPRLGGPARHRAPPARRTRPAPRPRSRRSGPRSAARSGRPGGAARLRRGPARPPAGPSGDSGAPPAP